MKIAPTEWHARGKSYDHGSLALHMTKLSNKRSKKHNKRFLHTSGIITVVGVLIAI